MTPEDTRVPAGVAKRILKSALVVLVVLFVVLVIARVPAALDRQESAERVAYINKQRMTMADVDGSNLPPTPDKAENDATIEGIDANSNGIRDDVERAIFEMYPGEENAALRAAALQYALGLQLELTQIMSEETYVAAVQQSGRGHGCITDAQVALSPIQPRDMSDEQVNAFFLSGDTIRSEIDALVINTGDRKEYRSTTFAQFATGHGDIEAEDCDIDPDILISDGAGE